MDGSELGERPLLTARELARRFNATIHLIQVVSRHLEIEGASSSGSGISPAAMELERDLAKNLVQARLSRGKQYLDGIASRLRSTGLEVKTTLAEGAADDQIVQYAKSHDIDLITMSRHGHSGLKRFFIGSVTDRVIRNGDTPVLVLPAY